MTKHSPSNPNRKCQLFSGKDISPEAWGGNVLPASYPIQYTDEFNKIFFENPIVRPPSEDRIKMWWERHGRYAWEHIQREAKEAHQEALKKHKRRAQQIRDDNQRLLEENQAIESSYREQLNAYEKALGNHTFHDPKIAATYLRECHKAALEAQQLILESRLNNVYRQAHRRLCRPTVLAFALGLITVYLWTLWHWPLLSPIPGAVIYICWQFLDVSRRDAFTELCKRDKYYIAWNNRWATDITRANTPFGDCPLLISFTPVFRENIYFSYGVNLNAAVLSGCDRPPLMMESAFVRWFLASCIPAGSLYVIAACIHSFLSGMFKSIDLSSQAKTAIQREHSLVSMCLDKLLQEPSVVDFLSGNSSAPKPPQKPTYRSYVLIPTPPAFKPPVRPLPPEDCYDRNPVRELKKILKGADLFNVTDHYVVACQYVFANREVQPYYVFGGLPITFHDGQLSHILLVGQSGSGKTTLIVMLMSSLLPLTQSQLKRIKHRTPKRDIPTPASSHEWSRSRTYQAVVYNAKSEYVPQLAALGFNPDNGVDSDLIILAPRDGRCFSWDIASDIADRDSIAKFAELLVPMSKESARKKDGDIWELQARRVIEAIIVSFRNAANEKGKRPSWTFWDLIVTACHRERLLHVLQHHDTPEDLYEQLFNLSSGQESSIYLSVTAYLSQFRTTAERWREAEKLGRKVSLKHWAKHCPGTVLVLPDTEENVTVHTPLNQAIFSALTDIFLTHEYSTYLDAKGDTKFRKRYVFIDEIGDAGKLPSLPRLMAQGRSFNVTCILGLHQLSQMERTYGPQEMKNIIGQCSYKAFLKQEDMETSEWMSKVVGEQLLELEKVTVNSSSHKSTSIAENNSETLTNAKGTNEGIVIGETDSTSIMKGRNNSHGRGPGGTTSQSGTNDSITWNQSTTYQKNEGSMEQISIAKQKGTTNTIQEGSASGIAVTHDLRKDFVMYGADFRQFPDPRTSGKIASVNLTPFLTTWRADIPFDALTPEYERPEAKQTVEHFMAWPDDDQVSRMTNWNEADYDRLGIEPRRADGFTSPNKSNAGSHIPLQRQLPHFGDTQNTDKARNPDNGREQLPSDFGW